jgi:ribonuclease H2 subunit B
MLEGHSKHMVWLVKDETHLMGPATSITLPHPRDRSISSTFLIAHQTCYELKAYTPEYRSWFVDQQVVSDGKLYILLEIDPLFLLLPHLHAMNKKVSE